MCVVSMIVDHYRDKWDPWKPLTPGGFPANPLTPKLPTKEEIAEFYELLKKKAREYDAKNNQSDCELEEKKQKLLDLAKELGIDIKFD